MISAKDVKALRNSISYFLRIYFDSKTPFYLNVSTDIKVKKILDSKTKNLQ